MNLKGIITLFENIFSITPVKRDFILLNCNTEPTQLPLLLMFRLQVFFLPIQMPQHTKLKVQMKSSQQHYQGLATIKHTYKLDGCIIRVQLEEEADLS